MTDCYNTSNEQPHPHEECDQTPFECPCFTRGGDKNLQLAIHHITEILDGKDDGIGVNREPWHTIRRRLLNLVNNDLSDFIREMVQEVNSKIPQLTHDDPHSFACGYNSGYKSCLLSIARRMGFSETQIAEMRMVDDDGL